MAEYKDGLRKFESGATRSNDVSKPDYEGFLSPIVIKAFGEYMNFHRQLPDGSLRDSDNWQKGIPQSAYMKSLLRHVVDLWLFQRGHDSNEVVFTLCAIIFNAQGYLHELIRECGEDIIGESVQCAAEQRSTFNAGIKPTKPKQRSR